MTCPLSVNIPSRLLTDLKVFSVIDANKGFRSSEAIARVMILATLSRCIANCTCVLTPRKIKVDVTLSNINLTFDS